MTVLLRFTSGIFRSLFHPPLISFLTFVLYIELFCSSPPVSSGLSFTPLTFYLLLLFYNFYQNFLRLAPDNFRSLFHPPLPFCFCAFVLFIEIFCALPLESFDPFCFFRFNQNTERVLREKVDWKLVYWFWQKTPKLMPWVKDTLDTYLNIWFLFLSFHLFTKSCPGRVCQCHRSRRKQPFGLLSDAQLHQHGEEPDRGVPPPHRPGGRVARHQPEGGRRGWRGYGRSVAPVTEILRRWKIHWNGQDKYNWPYLRSAEHQSQWGCRSFTSCQWLKTLLILATFLTPKLGIVYCLDDVN